MQLGDADGDATVDLFTNLMRINLACDPSTGVPGRARPTDSPPGKDFLSTIHELEHLVDLAHPLGLILTTLGMRALDEFRECRKLTGADYKGGGAEDLPNHIRDWGGVAVELTLLVEIELVLLEGLAMYAERSLEIHHMTDGSDAMDLAVSLSYQGARAFYRDFVMRFPDISPEAILDELWEAFIRDIHTARHANSGQGLATKLFYGPDQLGTGEESAHYFFGFLFVHRVLAQWDITTGGAIPKTRLLGGLHRIAAEVVPLLALRCLVEKGATEAFREMLVQVSLLIEAVPGFNSRKIDDLLSLHGTVGWDPQKAELFSLGDAATTVATAMAASGL